MNSALCERLTVTLSSLDVSIITKTKGKMIISQEFKNLKVLLLVILRRALRNDLRGRMIRTNTYLFPCLPCYHILYFHHLFAVLFDDDSFEGVICLLSSKTASTSFSSIYDWIVLAAKSDLFLELRLTTE